MVPKLSKPNHLVIACIHLPWLNKCKMAGLNTVWAEKKIEISH